MLHAFPKMLDGRIFPATLAGYLLVIGGAWGATGDLTLTVAAQDSGITLRTCSQFAGAVCSIVYRGKEHIDTRDHGRLLQSASSFDGYGECYNPTEGGARQDWYSSTSVLRAAVVEDNRIRTITDMAFWLRPLQAYPRGCGDRKQIVQAVNTVALSGHLLEKQVVVGLPGFPNVIEHRVTYYVPTHFSRATFEASTGYMPEEFSLAMYYDPASGIERDPGTRQGDQALPVILATPDRQYAMGVYSPDLPQKGLGYGRFTFPDVVKWNCAFRETNVQPGPYTYRCFAVLGTVAEVQDTLRRLYSLRAGEQLSR
ncbi:MAG: hypothetical protein ACRET6_11765 [Burkholderiales bacterium]